MNCKNCNKETSNPSYCSRSCSASDNNKKHPKKKKISSKLCSFNGCLKPIRKNSIMCKVHKIESSKISIENSTLSENMYTNHHISSAWALVRYHARNTIPDGPCVKCGYTKHTEVCHIKAIKDFDLNTKIKEVNSKSNLIRLCPNCHWEFDNLPRS